MNVASSAEEASSAVIVVKSAIASSDGFPVATNSAHMISGAPSRACSK